MHHMKYVISVLSWSLSHVNRQTESAQNRGTPLPRMCADISVFCYSHDTESLEPPPLKK
jgi:hypothetical protein